MYDHIARKLQSGELVILDGGVGTDIERRGVPMNDEAWCATANLTHGDEVRAVHEDYIRAGAEVITANTYASSPLSFASLGREDEIDLLIMEMMRDLETSLLATEAAVATGLPVWVGMSVERVDGSLLSHDNHQCTLVEMTRGLMVAGTQVALVMHNEISTTDEALEIIRAEWDGPIGAYPESGYFEMPHWVFRDLSPEDFVAACRRWREAGAVVLGGCCGMTPAHIEALSSALGQPVAQP
jgi:S-methylmethionine-dependent homocysteine/selenocysteine methylase